MIKVKQNNWFWILQLSGWGILVSTQVFTKLTVVKDLNKNYILAEGLLVFTAGIIISTLFRFVLQKSINSKTQKIDFLKVLITYILFSSFFASMLFIAIPLNNIFNNKPLVVGKLMIISNIVNSFIIFFIWALFYFVIKIIIKENRNKEERLKLKNSLKESQLNTLKGQINPHFMFNSLNNIRGLMLEDVDKSREMITRLSEMLRYSLTKNSLDKIALTEELEMVENYIALSKIQLEDRLYFTKEIDKTVLKTKIPPMLVQMLIENAIKHGISNLPKGGKVNLKIIKEANNLIIEVTNTGKLIIDKTSTKVGLENIKKRLSLLYQNKASFSLLEIKENVVAKIAIPV